MNDRRSHPTPADFETEFVFEARRPRKARPVGRLQVTGATGASDSFQPVPVESLGGGRIQDKRDPNPADLVEVPKASGGSVPLHRLAAQALDAMQRAARAEGIAVPLLLPTSGYRSVAKQAKLWKDALAKAGGDAKEARKWVAPPGGSPHHSGRAVDLYLGSTNAKENVGALRKTAAWQWLKQNAVRFGFYPYVAEPWHWEYNPPARSGESRELGEVRNLNSFIEPRIDVAAQRALMSMATKLTNLVFYSRHPERGGRPLKKGEPEFKTLNQEWLDIRDRLVLPALTPAKPAGPPSPSGGALQYGVPGGKIISGYLAKRSHGYHTGIDVSPSGSPGKGADDPRRGLPVYATVRTSIDIATLNSVQVAKLSSDKVAVPPWNNGLGIPGQGLATLREVRVRVENKANLAGMEYGGVVGLACRYTFTKSDGTPGIFTLFVEYWHLIVPGYLPKNGQGRILSLAEWNAAGKGDRIGLGPKMKDGALLKPADFANPPLVGYLGATQTPHVHIHANYRDGVYTYIFYPRLDPTAVIY